MKHLRVRIGVGSGLAITLLVAALLVASPVLAQDYAPTPVPGGEVTPIGDEGGTVNTPVVDINVPKGATGGNTYNFVYTPLDSVSCAPPAGCSLFAPFDLSIYVGIDLISPVTFDPPLELCFTYTEEQAISVGGVDNLTPAYWSADKGTWIPLDNVRYDASLMKVCGDLGTVTHTSCGIALTCAISPSGVPVTGEELAAGASLAPVWLALAAAAVLILGVGALRKVRAS